MKMKQQRQLEKNPPYKHICQCSYEDEYLTSLPETTTCVNPQYFERQKDGTWVDVSDQVSVSPY